ncbi:MAG: ribosome biogenesis GTPase Der [Candidatus Omnitrophica bacterium]|nr:ribosome biogenesis GTPase Der [Candidatus Omnitrophota bacterium]
MSPAKFPAVCIVGRPNVGKSTLFNRIIGKRRAVVHQTSGTTRDSVEALCEKEDGGFKLVDTGGFLKTVPDKISSLVKRQIERAITEADILLFVCDISSGVTPQDEELLPILRRSGKKVFLVVNKADNERLEERLYDFYKLGLGNPYPVSAIHNRGIGRLIEDVLEAAKLAEGKGKGLEEVIYKIAITGRPNVGKSLFLNTLLNEDRVIVDPMPGTTRDSIDTYFKKDKDFFLLIDTAGIRHKRKVNSPIDAYSMLRSEEAIERSDVAFLLIDGYDGLRNDDVRILNFIIESGRCCVLVVNKWDLVKKIEMSYYKDAMIRKAPMIVNYPIIFASAKTSRNVASAIDMVKYVVENSRRAIKTKELNDFLMLVKRQSARITKRVPKLYYIVQASVKPPTFVVFVNDIKLVKKGFTSFLERVLRERFFFLGSPVRIAYRRKR